MQAGEAAEKTVEGTRTRGLGVGGRYISHPYYSEAFRRILGCTPFPGTLNIEASVDWRQLAAECEPIVVPETVWEGRRLGAVYAWEAVVETSRGPVQAALIRPLLSRHPPNVLEIVACEKLAPLLPGDRVRVRIRCHPNPDYTKPPRI
jgi:riboflavin kinase